jgi:hypothetical protein
VAGGARHARRDHGRDADAGSVPGGTGHGCQPAGARSRGDVRRRAVGSRAAGRRRWAAGVVARPGRHRGDPAAGGYAGRAAARCGVGACRRLRSVADPGAAAGSDPGAAAGSDPGAAAGSDPGAAAGSDPGAAASSHHPDPATGGRRAATPRLIVAAGAPPHAAARARATRRATPRSTARGAGSRAARPAVRAASPGPTAAPRAGARSTSVQTSPSAQVVAPRSA